MSRLLSASSVTYSIKSKTILDRIDLVASAGELVVFVGPNGAGKSTLLRLLAGDLKPTSGEVQILGRPIRTTPRNDLALARAFLGPEPVRRAAFTVREVVRLGRHPHSVSRNSTIAHDEAVVGQSMVAADVGAIADQALSELSSGEAQRVGVARLLAQRSPISLLDEPTSSLDIGHQDLVMSALKDLCAGEATVVAVLHDLNLAARFATRLVLMGAGRIISDGPPGQVLESQLLSEVYAHPISVSVNPATGGPLIVPGVR